ncbi:carboxyl-terminal processing protease [Burkholderiales bacterium]|jgi:carboxyl-terminal processing protease|nr:carboxyl-terminal processing protease [Burkholderiales bacterium]
MDRTSRGSRAFVASLCVLLGAAAIPSRPAWASGLSCEAIPNLVDAILQNHVRFRQLDDGLEQRAIDAYVRRLDPSRTLFLEKEVADLKQQLRPIFAEAEQGKCDRLKKVQLDLVTRYHDMESYFRSLVERPGYQIDNSVTLVTDPEKRGHPKTIEERNELYQKLAHFQMSNYVSSGTPLDEAKKQLVHRYELLTRQARDQKPDDVYTAFLDSFAQALDPHSNYLSADDVEDFQIGMGLSLEGIGLALSSRDGYVVVEEVITGGAAERAQTIKPKDKIIAVTQESGSPVNVIDMPLRDVVKMIRGKKGTPVELTVLRQGETTERFTTTIVRDKIDLEEQAAKLRFETREIDGKPLKLAILELPSFYGDRDASKRQSDRDVEDLLAQVEKEKADGLLLDLSRNGGGLLEHAVGISGLFVRKGPMVAVQHSPAQTQMLPDPDGEIRYSGPLVVLTSRASASASEILAGALKDYKRAVIVGDDHTFGKGTVQSVVPLREGLGALKVTTALFFRPGGESTQLSGVPADVVIPSAFDLAEIGEVAQPYSLPGQKIEPFVAGSANASVSQEGRYLPVTPDLVRTLTERSQSRVAQSPEFVELAKKREESKRNDGVIRLSEIEKDRKKEEAETEAERQGGAAARAEARAKSPQVQEAVSILADLVQIQRQILASQGEAQHQAQAKPES